MSIEKSISILIVDDEISARRLLLDILEDQYLVTLADSTSQALDIIVESIPDIVITDIKMPGKDGLSLLSQMKAKYPSIAVILVTGHGEKSTIISAVKEGAFDYLDKPFLEKDILKIVHRAEKYCILQRKFKEAEDEKNKTFESQKILYLLLQTSQQNLPFDQLLGRCLEIIVNNSSFIPFKGQGSIFIVEEKPDQLILKAHCRLSKFLHTECTKISFGHCICGEAAKSKKIVFSNCMDDHSKNHNHNRAEPHGHYCVPILAKNTVVGVLNLYLKISHERDTQEEKFLQAIADTLAGIIERKNMEQEKENVQSQLIQSSKLASIGVLASGIAHELNNPLTTVMGHSQLLKNVKNNPDKVEEKAGKIHFSAQRMKSIVDHLRTYSRESKSEDWQQFAISKPINNALEFLSSQLKLRNISLKISSPDDPLFSSTDQLCRVYGDMTQLESVFQNLLVNSRDAFEEIKDDREKCISITLEEEDCIRVVYEDNATGMTKDVMDNIFDPFFTTKETGKGTGLGMSISKNIIEEHKGSIVVESEHGKGSKFTMTFTN